MDPDDIHGVRHDELDLPPAKDARKAEKKLRKKLEESLETGTLTPWERYRVLIDLLEMFNDISEMADRKTRFALVILGALNTVNILVVARPEVFLSSGLIRGQWLAVYLAAYVGLSLFLFVQAIGALKPRVSTLLNHKDSAETSNHQVLGLRFISNIRNASFEDYYERWRKAQFADINREVALSIKMVSSVVTEKYAALHRLYSGLMVLVFLTAGLIIVLVYLHATLPST